jgi:hypothetical protein
MVILGHGSADRMLIVTTSGEIMFMCILLFWLSLVKYFNNNLTDV